MFNGQEKTGVSARSSKRGADLSLGEMDGLARKQVGGNDSQRNFHLGESSRGSETMEEIIEALVGSHAHARKRPASKITEASQTSLASHFVEGCSAGIGGGDQSANAGAGDEINGNLVLFQDAQYANVGDAPRESAAQRDSDFGPRTAGVIGE